LKAAAISGGRYNDPLASWNRSTTTGGYCSWDLGTMLRHNGAFTGQLPNPIVNLSKTLQVLDFSATGIWGSIPSAIGNLVGLESLGDNDASISGVLPDSIGKLGNLTSNLSGQIPSSIGNLSKLTILTAFSSNLEGFRRS
jgi:hypothetical protein